MSQDNPISPKTTNEKEFREACAATSLAMELAMYYRPGMTLDDLFLFVKAKSKALGPDVAIKALLICLIGINA